ncbi:MAG: cytidine deaminase [Sulfuritalea sp.]|jgi:cytidine deaminase|nr:cytidine deaminase [Sulfuritalea sp.]
MDIGTEVGRDKLIELARDALSKAYSPYSRVSVGAALVAASGKIYTGCNVENVSFGLTNCAERTAVFKGVSEEGETFKILAIAIVANRNGSRFPISPCGACRQVLLEFGQSSGSLCFFLNSDDVVMARSFIELLPDAFILPTE